MAGDSSERKKMTNVYILEILKKYTADTYDSYGYPDNCLTQAQIVKLLLKDYGIELDRKAVSRGLNDLVTSPEYCNKIEFDCETRKAKIDGKPQDQDKKTNFRYCHDFDSGQIRLLMDAVLFSKNISESECKDLIEKIGNLVPGNKASKHICKLSEIKSGKVTSDTVIGNLDILDEAIEKNRKIRFIYNTYGTDKKLHPKCDADGIVIVKTANPYNIIANDGKFYLVANYDDFDNAINIRIDKMTDLCITDEPARPKKEIKGLNLGMSTFAEQLFMLSGESERVVFKASRHIVSQIIDWFGNSVKFTEENDAYVICSVKVNLKAMRYWTMQYSDYVEILEPQKLRDDVKNAILVAWRKYKEDNEEIMLNESEIDNIIAGWKDICFGEYEKLDVSKLGELVKKTHIAFLPFKCGSDKEMSLKYKDLLLTLHQVKDSKWIIDFEQRKNPEKKAVINIVCAFINFVERKMSQRIEQFSNDNNIVVPYGLKPATIDINNFEEDFNAYVEILRIQKEQREAEYEAYRKNRKAEKALEERPLLNHAVKRGAPRQRKNDVIGKVKEGKSSK